MSPLVSDPGLRDRLADFVAERLGLHYPPERWVDLEMGLHAALGSPAPAEFARCLQRLPDLPPRPVFLELLAAALTIGETYFFREPRTLEVLRDRVMPELIARRQQTTRQLRLWSAGC